MWWLAGIVGAVALAATYLTWTASRVERLHSRARHAAAALVDKLNLRAEVALLLAAEASVRLGRHAEAIRVGARAALDSPPDQREAAENDLTRILRDLPLPSDDEVLADLRVASRRVAIAKEVHTDLVRDALNSRSRHATRLFRLARDLCRPTYFNIDDPR